MYLLVTGLVSLRRGCKAYSFLKGTGKRKGLEMGRSDGAAGDEWDETGQGVSGVGIIRSGQDDNGIWAWRLGRGSE